MNHSTTRVLLAFPIWTSPVFHFQHKSSDPCQRPCHLGGSHPELHHTHIQSQGRGGRHQILMAQHLNPEHSPPALN